MLECQDFCAAQRLERCLRPGRQRKRRVNNAPGWCEKNRWQSTLHKIRGPAPELFSVQHTSIWLLAWQLGSRSAWRTAGQLSATCKKSRYVLTFRLNSMRWNQPCCPSKWKSLSGFMMAKPNSGGPSWPSLGAESILGSS